jgi:uncharacterized protein YdgA (DUF945 family)
VKKTLIVVLVLVAILLALPFAEGFWVQKKYYNLNKLVSQRTPLTLKVIDYHRGWFSSSATIQVSANQLANTSNGLPEDSHFIVKEKLYHGPIILRSFKPYAAFGKGITFALALSETHVNQPDLQLSSLAVYHYNGNIDIKFDCPIFTFPSSKPGDVYSIKGLKGSFGVSKRFKHSEGKIFLSAADIPQQGAHQLINDAKYQYSLDKNGYDLWYGKRSLEIGNLVLNYTDKWHAKGLSLSLTDHSNSHELNSHLEAKLNALNVNGIDYGKQQLVFNLSNLNIQAFNDLSRKADLLDQQGSPLSIKTIQLTPLAIQLLSKGLSINLSAVELNTKWGTFNANVSLEIPKFEKAPSQFQALLSGINGQADLYIPTKLLADMLEIRYQALTTPEQQKQNGSSPQALARENIERWVLAGWLIPALDHYQVRVNYKSNQLMFNGKLMKLPNLPLPIGIMKQ